MADIKLSAEATEVIRRSTIKDNILILPNGILPRPLYEEVNAIFRHAGGRWSRKDGGHRFERNPSELLAKFLADGRTVDVKKRDQAFYTPEPLARQLAIAAAVEGKVVLEPSAGEGALVKACLECGAAMMDAVEKNEDAAGRLMKLSRTRVHCGDFLGCQPGSHPWMRESYERIVMNPPFAKGAAGKHLAHALRFLAPGGRLVAVLPASWTREILETFLRLRMKRPHGIVRLANEPGAFKESGTNVSTITAVVTEFRFSAPC